MKIELERSVNLVKGDIKSFTLPELLDIVNPMIQRLTELTTDNKRQGRILDWQIDGQKQEIKKLSSDIELLKQRKDQLQKTIDAEMNKAFEEANKLKEEAKFKLADAISKQREVEAKEEELEKKKYFREVAKV